MSQHEWSGEPATYAIGDLHGEVTLLKQLLSKLPFRPEDTLVFLGDYMDRGEDSVGAIRTLRDFQRRHPNCVFLRGNHDEVWLEHWDDVRFLNPPSIEGAQKVWDENNGKIPHEVGFFLEHTVIEYEDNHGYYVHAGVLPNKPFWRSASFLKLWGPVGFLESKYDWGKPVICGHWGLDEPLVESNKICVDTGAYKSGVLSAIRLPDRSIFQATLP